MAAVQAVESVLMNSGASLDLFIEEKLSESYRNSMPADELRDHLQMLRSTVAGAGGLDIARENDDLLLRFSDGADATVVVRLAEDGSIDHLGLREKKAPEEMTENERVDEARRVRMRAIEALGSRAGDGGLMAFADEHLSKAYRQSIGESRLMEQLGELRTVVGAAGGIMVSVTPEGTLVSFRGSKNADVMFTLEAAKPYRIASMEIDFDAVGSEELEGAEVAPMSWENLEPRLREEEAAGFAGTVLVVREGEVVLHQAYGLASREPQRQNTIETVYDIGSVPIDFTRAAILKLQDRGLLELSDSITEYVENVPVDKESITLEHLMTGQSGLPNFHHTADDGNRDLSWIDRAEAVRRILDQPLLFPPGEDDSHSHSAYTLLAAIVEKVSSQAYDDFLRSTFFDPIGMSRTGFYGDTDRFDDDEMAVGYGFEQASPVNNPRHWGPASWLVIGAGGMVSTPGDMYKWLQAMYSGDYLSDEAMATYRHGGVLAGGSDRGFLMMYVDNPETTVIVSSNVHAAPGDLPMAVSRALVDLIRQCRTL